MSVRALYASLRAPAICACPPVKVVVASAQWPLRFGAHRLTARLLRPWAAAAAAAVAGGVAAAWSLQMRHVVNGL